MLSNIIKWIQMGVGQNSKHTSSIQQHPAPSRWCQAKRQCGVTTAVFHGEVCCLRRLRRESLHVTYVTTYDYMNIWIIRNHSKSFWISLEFSGDSLLGFLEQFYLALPHFWTSFHRYDITTLNYCGKWMQMARNLCDVLDICCSHGL